MGQIKAWLRNRLRSMGRSSLFQRLPDHHNVVLMYHSVGGVGYGNITQKTFRNHVRWLDQTYDIVDLPEVLEDGGSKQVALTFDDGYHSFADAVAPVIEEFSVPATVFVVGKTLEDESFVHDGPPEKRSYLTIEQLRNLKASELVTIGNHTHSHCSLPNIESSEKLATEITGSKELIEDRLDISVNRFCYPYGNWSDHSRSVVGQEHEYAVGGIPVDAFITPETDPLVIPRVDAAVTLSTLQYDVSDTSTYLSRLTNVGSNI